MPAILVVWYFTIAGRYICSGCLVLGSASDEGVCRAVVRMATASEEELSENLRWAVVVLMVERSHKGLNTEYCHLVDGTYWSSH